MTLNSNSSNKDYLKKLKEKGIIPKSKKNKDRQDYVNEKLKNFEEEINNEFDLSELKVGNIKFIV